jgi:hypothetical protein
VGDECSTNVRVEKCIHMLRLGRKLLVEHHQDIPVQFGRQHAGRTENKFTWHLIS